MQKRGRPRLYYDNIVQKNIHQKSIITEMIDILLNQRLINATQHRLAMKLRWMFTINFGLPTVQAYNMLRVKGRDISKYDDITISHIRQQYKEIIDFMYKSNKDDTKIFLNVVIYQKNVNIYENATAIINSATNLEKAFKKIMYTNTTTRGNNNLNKNVYVKPY